MAGSVLPRLFNLDFSASGGTANRKWHNKTSARNSLVRKARRYLTVAGLLSAMILVPNMRADAAPQGGTVVAGTANIVSAPSTVTVKQSSQDSIINWQSFSVGKTESVIFQQPNVSSVTLNRVVGGEPSLILGRLSANGQVFLINPNGALFAKGAQVNVGGLVVSTLDITNSDFMAGRYNFAGSSENGVVNEGSITAGDGGYVALLGAKVDNEGVITAKLGTVALAAGAGMTLDVAGNGLLNVVITKEKLNALAKNGGLIAANGGQVLMTAQAAGQLVKTAVNNTGIIEAQTIDSKNGTIKLLGDSEAGTVNVGGTLDASAPNGGDGGSIETSAAHVYVDDRPCRFHNWGQRRYFGSDIVSPPGDQ
jgi:filamentous hemagglutinin family protein